MQYKESFGQLWSSTYKGAAKRFWENWKEQLKWQRREPYKKFANMIDNHIDGILGYCDKKVSIGYIEGTNLKANKDNIGLFFYWSFQTLSLPLAP